MAMNWYGNVVCSMLVQRLRMNKLTGSILSLSSQCGRDSKNFNLFQKKVTWIRSWKERLTPIQTKGLPLRSPPASEMKVSEMMIGLEVRLRAKKGSGMILTLLKEVRTTNRTVSWRIEDSKSCSRISKGVYQIYSHLQGFENKTARFYFQPHDFIPFNLENILHYHKFDLPFLFFSSVILFDN